MTETPKPYKVKTQENDNNSFSSDDTKDDSTDLKFKPY